MGKCLLLTEPVFEELDNPEDEDHDTIMETSDDLEANTSSRTSINVKGARKRNVFGCIKLI